jgi:hypothetical protein
MHAELMDLLMAAEKDRRKTSISPEAAIERLKEAAARFNAGNPYKVGDIVTPIKDSPIKGHGNPHLVLEVSAEGFPVTAQTAGSWVSATAFTLRVLTIDDGSIVPHIMPHWMVEPFQLD